MRDEITPEARSILARVFAAAGVELVRDADGVVSFSGVSGNAVERRGSIRRRNGVSNALNPLGVPPPPAFAGASRQET